jgi:hypothetical protein
VKAAAVAVAAVLAVWAVSQVVSPVPLSLVEAVFAVAVGSVTATALRRWSR